MNEQDNTPDAEARAFYWLGRLYARVSNMMVHEDDLVGRDPADRRSIAGVRHLQRPADHLKQMMFIARCCIRNFEVFGRHELRGKCEAALADINAHIAPDTIPAGGRRASTQEVIQFAQGKEQEYLLMADEGTAFIEKTAVSGR